MINFFLSEITDRFVRQNFEKLAGIVNKAPFRKGLFRFIECKLANESAAATYPASVTFLHELGFQPKDLILVSVSPDTVTVRPKFDSFTRTHVAFVISAPCTLRFYVGRYEEDR